MINGGQLRHGHMIRMAENPDAVFANATALQRLDVRIGDMVIVRRAGDGTRGARRTRTLSWAYLLLYRWRHQHEFAEVSLFKKLALRLGDAPGVAQGLGRCEQDIPVANQEGPVGRICRINRECLPLPSPLRRLGSISERRFRPNFYISGCDAHGEDAWIGGAVRLGAIRLSRRRSQGGRLFCRSLGDDTLRRDHGCCPERRGAKRGSHRAA